MSTGLSSSEFTPGPLFRRLVPSPVDILLIGTYLASLSLPVISEDLWWRLEAGEWVSQNFDVPHTNIFSFAAPNHPWINHEWLSDTLLFLVFDRLGFGWLLFLRGAMYALILGLLFRLLRRRGGVFPSLALTTTVAVAFLLDLHIGPLLFSCLFLVLMLTLLEDAKWRYGRTLVSLPLLFMLWANTHGSFLLGLVLLGAHGFGDYLDALRQRGGGSHFSHLTAAGLAIPLTLCNPYYGAVYRLGFEDLWQLIVSATFRLRVLPLPFLSVAGVLVFGAWLTVALAGREVRWRLVLPLILLTPIAALMPGFGTLWMVWGAVANMEHIQQVADRVRHGGSGYLERPNKVSRALRHLGDHFAAFSRLDRYMVHGNYLALTLALAIAYFSIPPGDSLQVVGTVVRGLSLEEIVPEQQMPRSAVRVLRRNAATGSRVLSPIRWGGFVIWAGYPDLMTFVDSRESAYPLDVVEDYDLFEDSRPGWEEVLEQHEVDYVIWPTQSLQVRVLMASGLWVRLYHDSNSAVLGRRYPRETKEASPMALDTQEVDGFELESARTTPLPAPTPKPSFGLFRPNRSGPNEPR